MICKYKNIMDVPQYLRRRTVQKFLFISFLLIISTLSICEYVFRHHVAIMSSMPTLVRRNWKKKYWWPVNSLGCRDLEHKVQDLKHTKNIIIVGDSVTAGWGIKDYRDRYPDLLQKKLDDSWEIINISVPGWNIREKVEAVIRYPYFGDIKVRLVIFQYYFDDLIPGAAEYCGPPITDAVASLPESFFYKVVSKSYFADYLYWKLYQISIIFKWSFLYKFFAYLDCLEKNTENIAASGFEELKPLIGFCESNNIKLVFLNSPHLESDNENRRVFNGFWKNLNMRLNRCGFLTADPAILYNQYSIKTLTVNRSDCHPNEKAHEIMADLLLEKLKMDAFFLRD